MPLSSAGTGFGISGEGHPDPAATQRPQIPQEDQQRLLTEDIHAIRRRYVRAPVNDPQVFTGIAAGTAVRLDTGTTEINAVTITTTNGQVSIWFGDYLSGGRPNAAHIIVAAGTTLQLALAPKPYVFTAQAVGATSDFCIIPQDL